VRGFGTVRRMSTVDDAFVARVRAIAEQGAAAALSYFRRPVDVANKAGGEAFDPVTPADRAAEATIRAAVETEFPSHGILGEEFGEKEAESPWRWVIDPIDGTRGFMSGTPTWTTLVAIEHERKPVVGVIVQPHVGETWVGRPGRTELHRQGSIEVAKNSGIEDLGAARLSTTDPRAVPLGYLTPDEAAAFAAIGARVRVARFSLDAYAYALLASGHLDLVIETGLERYDIAALVPVVEGAGGCFSDWEGGPGHAASRVVASATPRLHEAALDALQGASRP
jgi:histidinol phosphatase-like enzyme (inositol monophosphatase family)